MNIVEVKIAWAKAVVLWPERAPSAELEPTFWKIYSEALCDVDADIALLFMEYWVANGKWWPKPGDLRSWVLEQIGSEITVDGIWVELLAHLDAMYERDAETARLPIQTRHNTSIYPWPKCAADLQGVIDAYGGWDEIYGKRHNEFLRKELKKTLEGVAGRRRLEAQQPGNRRFKTLETRLRSAPQLAAGQRLALAAGDE